MALTKRTIEGVTGPLITSSISTSVVSSVSLLQTIELLVVELELTCSGWLPNSASGSKGLPGIQMEATQRVRQDTWNVKETRPVRSKPRQRRSCVYINAPQIPATLEHAVATPT